MLDDIPGPGASAKSTAPVLGPETVDHFFANGFWSSCVGVGDRGYTGNVAFAS